LRPFGNTRPGLRRNVDLFESKDVPQTPVGMEKSAGARFWICNGTPSLPPSIGLQDYFAAIKFIQ
jgi:hypothetical protein